jgi:hypothetical protein
MLDPRLDRLRYEPAGRLSPTNYPAARLSFASIAEQSGPLRDREVKSIIKFAAACEDPNKGVEQVLQIDTFDKKRLSTDITGSLVLDGTDTFTCSTRYAKK